MTARRSVLGRGIGALIRESSPAPSPVLAAPGPSPEPYFFCPLEQIHPNPTQPRKDFHYDTISNLSQNVREHGILQPLVVRRAGRGFEIIAGERRWRAARLAGLKDVPVLVREASDAESLEMALIENLHREDLNPIEQAGVYKRLIEEMGYSHEKLAERLGRDRTTLTNTIRLLGLAPAVRRMVAEGALSPGHARPLLGIGDPHEQLRLAREIVQRGIPVRQVEALVREGRGWGPAARERRVGRGEGKAGGGPAEVRDLERRLREALLTQVRIVTAGRDKGRIEIRYDGLDQLDGLVERILGTGRS